MPGVVFVGGALVALLIPLGPHYGTFSMSYPPPPPNDLLVRLSIAGGASLVAMPLAGIDRPSGRPRFWGGALILAVALGIALLVPRGGPYFPVLPPYHGPMIRIAMPQYDQRNALRLAIAGIGALAALVVAFGEGIRSVAMRSRSKRAAGASI
jgi:hypothetical protein